MDTRKASQLINSLTANEDLRQDLWVEYLSGTPISKLPSKAFEKAVAYDIQSSDRAAYELAILDIPLNLLNLFNAVEKHVVFLLYLGYNIGEISVTLGESRVTIMGLVSSIKQNIAWDELKWRLKDPSLMKRNSA